MGLSARQLTSAFIFNDINSYIDINYEFVIYLKFAFTLDLAG
jgi:hypothetical protein